MLHSSEEKTAQKRKKHRSPWEKEGKFRYLNRKLLALRDETRAGFKRVEARQRVLINTLQPTLQFEEAYIVQVVCQDEADNVLLDYLVSQGDLGITPSEACQYQPLRKFKFKPFHITRRVQRMNKRLKIELGKPVAESYHRRWVITSFILKSVMASEEELKSEN